MKRKERVNLLRCWRGPEGIERDHGITLRPLVVGGKEGSRLRGSPVGHEPGVEGDALMDEAVAAPYRLNPGDRRPRLMRVGIVPVDHRRGDAVPDGGRAAADFGEAVIRIATP